LNAVEGKEDARVHVGLGWTVDVHTGRQRRQPGQEHVSGNFILERIEDQRPAPAASVRGRYDLASLNLSEEFLRRRGENLRADLAAWEVARVDVEVELAGLELCGLRGRNREDCSTMLPEVAAGSVEERSKGTPALAPAGAGPWMCAMVAALVSPLKARFTKIRSSAALRTTVPVPLAVLVVAGTS